MPRILQPMTSQPVKHASMPIVDRHALIQLIHDAPTQIVLAATGGGSLAVSDLLTMPGASRTLIDALVPYSSGSLSAFLEFQPRQQCSAETARQMATRAFEQAQERQPDTPTAGVACTASLVSDRQKRGEHRLHVAVQSEQLTSVVSLVLHKGARDRTAEERLAADVILNQVAKACGLAERLALDLRQDEQVQVDELRPPQSWQDLLAANSRLAASGPYDPAAPPRIVYPGAFHPIHAAHRGIAAYALAHFEGPLAYEISVVNPDKPTLDFLDMRDRAAQFAADELLLFTRAATFAEKAELFPGALFLVGADTIARIDDPRYYDHCRDFRDEAVAALAASGCRFLVFGREVEGRFTQLSDLSLGEDLRQLCKQVPGEEFRMDVSSTKIRTEVGDG